MNVIDIVFSSLFANNLLLFQYFGLAERLEAAESGRKAPKIAVLGVMVASASLLFWLVDRVLLAPWHGEALRPLLLVAVTLICSWLGTLVASVGNGAGAPFWPGFRTVLLHSFLAGAVLASGSRSPQVLEVLITAVAVTAGYGGALILLGAVQARLSRDAIPALIRGLPLHLITLGLFWLAARGLAFSFGGPAP